MNLNRLNTCKQRSIAYAFLSRNYCYWVLRSLVAEIISLLTVKWSWFFQNWISGGGFVFKHKNFQAQHYHIVDELMLLNQLFTSDWPTVFLLYQYFANTIAVHPKQSRRSSSDVDPESTTGLCIVTSASHYENRRSESCWRKFC